MIKEYFDPKHPMQDGRKGKISDDERIASWAGRIIRGSVGDDALYYIERSGIAIPKPNSSARIRSRKNDWVEVEASAEFFAQVDEFSKRLLRYLNS